jgi:hypothetical protein
MIGTAIEWYDFFVYGTSVVLVLGPLFFPATDPLTSSLLAFSTFGVGFLVRPVGAAVLSHSVTASAADTRWCSRCC